MHQITGFLLDPVVWGLLFFIALAVYETGLAIGERFGGIQRLADSAGLVGLRQAGKRRIERADFAEDFISYARSNYDFKNRVAMYYNLISIDIRLLKVFNKYIEYFLNTINQRFDFD